MNAALTYLLIGISVAATTAWLVEMIRHSRSRRRLEAEARARSSRLAGAIIRTRHAYVSELYNSDTLEPRLLVKEALAMAKLLDDCDHVLERAELRSAQRGTEPDLTPQMDQIQEFVATCGALRDPFFRDTSLFYVAGLLEYGGREDEARFLRENLRHGTLRAKAAQAAMLLLTPPLPKKMRAPKGAHRVSPRLS